MLTTFDTSLRAFFDALLRFQAFFHLPLPTGLGTQIVFLRGKWPSQYSIIERTSDLSQAMMTSSTEDNSRINGANRRACAGWSITQPVAMHHRK